MKLANFGQFLAIPHKTQLSAVGVDQ